MVPIHLLWLPILLSAVVVFVVSSLLHMVVGHHANDYRKLPNDDATAEALRKLNIPEGQYVYPRPDSMKDMKSAGFQEKAKNGPRFLLTIWPGGAPSMTSNLIQWFIFSLVVGVFSAYVAGRALGPWAPYLAVFRFAGVTAFACYALAGWQETIWYKRPWMTSLKNTIDGLVYALLTAGVFGWLWPR